MAESTADAPRATSNRSTTPVSDAFKDYISTQLGRARRMPCPRPARAAPLRRRPPRPHLGACTRASASSSRPGAAKVRSNDTDYPYRAHSAFAHLTGWGSTPCPAAVLVLEPTADGHDATLYFRERAGRDSDEFYANPEIGEFWIGPRPSLAQVAGDLGLATRGHRRVRRRARRGRRRHPARARRRPRPHRPGRRPPAARRRTSKRQIVEANDGDAELARDLCELRLVKDAYEIEQMRLAVAATKQGFDDVIADLPADHRAPARRAPGRGHLQPPRPRGGQHRRLRHDRRQRAARLHPALDPQRRAGRCRAT